MTNQLSAATIKMLNALAIYVSTKHTDLVAVLQTPDSSTMFDATVGSGFIISQHEGMAEMVERLTDQIALIRGLDGLDDPEDFGNVLDLGDRDVTSVALAILKQLRRSIPMIVPDFDGETDKSYDISVTGRTSGAVSVICGAVSVMSPFIEGDTTPLESTVVTREAEIQGFRDSIGNRLPEYLGYWEEGRG